MPHKLEDCVTHGKLRRGKLKSREKQTPGQCYAAFRGEADAGFHPLRGCDTSPTGASRRRKRNGRSTARCRHRETRTRVDEHVGASRTRHRSTPELAVICICCSLTRRRNDVRFYSSLLSLLCRVLEPGVRFARQVCVGRSPDYIPPLHL